MLRYNKLEKMTKWAGGETMHHKGTQIIETPRLILRPFTMDDAEAMFRNWHADEEVTKFLTWQAVKSVEETKAV